MTRHLLKPGFGEMKQVSAEALEAVLGGRLAAALGTKVRAPTARSSLGGLTARGESLAAFDGRCIPAGSVAPPSNTPGILGRRALPAGRLARLGATQDFHHGLLRRSFVTRLWLVGLAFVMAFPALAVAEKSGKNADKKGEKVVKPIAVDTYDELFGRYLAAARKQATAVAPDPSSWMNSLMTDTRARHLNDLVTVRVVESITASGTADSSTNKASGATVGVPNLLGLEGKLPALIDPSNLVSAKTSTSFKGGGSTNRAGDVTAVIDRKSVV